jgi:glycosyltransferase involved in cell wall biosynthesis
MKTVMVFNFDLPSILQLWKKEGHSAHHLWGATELYKYDIEVEFLPYEKFSLLKKIGHKLKFLGDLDQQLRIFLNRDQYDVIYSAHHLNTAVLAFLRKVKLLNKPIVAIAHRSFKKTLFSQLFTALFVEGNDKILCLSEATKHHLHDSFGIPEAKLDTLPWCIDIQYEKLSDANIVFALSESRYILSSGRTHRDYETLLSAFEEIDYSLRILGCSPILNEKDARSLYLDYSQVPDNISFVDRFIPTPEALDEIKQAYAVAIPLKIYDKEPCSAIGLTSLLEAMAMGKAVVITRSEYVGIDVEKERIGLVVEPRDVDGWRRAITFLLNNPDSAQEMGYRGRQLVKDKYNLDFFTKELADHLHRIANV